MALLAEMIHNIIITPRTHAQQGSVVVVVATKIASSSVLDVDRSCK